MNILLKLLGELAKGEETIRGLAKKTKTSYSTALRTINNHNDLIETRKIGKAKLCKLSKDSIIKHYLIISEREKAKEYLERNPEIKFLATQLPKGKYAAILFGSRAEETHREKSDIDLALISKEKPRFKAAKYEAILGKEINIIKMAPEELQEMLEEPTENIGKQILKKHVILKGEETFWETAWNSKNS